VLRVLGFFSGGAVMIVEFSGTRLLSPGFGNSLYTWTGLIGVVLVALSLGDYIGGWIIDKFQSSSPLPILFSAGGALTAAIPLLSEMLPEPQTMGVVFGPVFASMALFFFPGVVLAAITPVSIRLLSRAYGDQRIGAAAGTVGMAAALGSFVGTFASSYVLIPHFGVREIFVILGGLLIAIGVALAFSFRTKTGGGLWMLWLGGAGVCWLSSQPEQLASGVIHQEDTFYHRITVLDVPHGPNRTGRYLKLDSTFEGAQDVATGALLFEYQRYWRLAEVFCPDLKAAVFLGAGAFGMPEHLAARYPSAHVDVAEIDPAVIEVGRKFFRLDSFPAVAAHAEDGRRFLQRSPRTYDFIFGDAYNGVQYVPAHLVTREFFTLVRERLTPEGVFVMNLIGSVDGPNSEFFWRVYHSVQAALPNVTVLGVTTPDLTAQQNLIIVAGSVDVEAKIAAWRVAHAGQRSPIAALLDTRLTLPHEPKVRGLFTDNRNPVEYIVARQTVAAAR
jgi:spermidine synthase